MAKKSIIEIDVNDEKWQTFMKSFDAYEKALEDMPDAWKKIGESMGHSGGTLSQTAKQAMQYLSDSAGHIEEMARGLKSATKAQEQFGQSTGVSKTKLKGLTTEAKSLAHTLFGIGKTLFKIGTIGAFAGIAGMFGLSESAYRRQREARGFGMSTGMVGAFRTNMKPFVNPDKMLEIGANLPYSLENIGPLALMGLNRTAMLGETPEKRAFDIINRAHELWKSGRRNQYDPMVQALEKVGLSYEDYRRIGVTPGSQLRAAEARTMQDARTMNIDKTAQAFTRLKIELDRAGLQIETILVKGLAPLAPVFVNMAKGLTRDFVHFMDAPGTKKSIANMGKTLEGFVRFLGSKDFHQDVTDFATALKDLTKAVLWTADKIGKATGFTLSGLSSDIGDNPKSALLGGSAGAIAGGLGAGPLGAVAGGVLGASLSQVPWDAWKGMKAMIANDLSMAKGTWSFLTGSKVPSHYRKSASQTGKSAQSGDAQSVLGALGVKTRPTAHKSPVLTINNNTASDLFWSANGISH